MFFWRCFRGFVLPVLEYCSSVWCSTVIHLKILDRVVSGARFLTVGVFECNIIHRLCVGILYILHNIRFYPMHPLYGTRPVLYIPVIVTGCASVAHRYTYAPPRCKSRANNYC